MTPQRATIVNPGTPGMNYGEPRAELEDGRTMPMGRNAGSTYPIGTTGTAEYVRTPNSGLWQFTPDTAPEPVVLETDRMTVINLEPNWDGVRAWVLHVHKTDPMLARKLASEMGREAPELPAP